MVSLLESIPELELIMGMILIPVPIPRKNGIITPLVSAICIFSAVVVLGVKLETRWTDSRLNDSLPEYVYCRGSIYSSVVEKMWLPRPYMVSTAYIEPVKTNPVTDYYFYVPPIFKRYQELNIAVQCPFEFSYYPFDSQTCRFQFHSSSYTDGVVNYTSKIFDESDILQHALKYEVAYREFTDEEDFYIGYEGGGQYSACGFYIGAMYI